jgi:hypothetical protein
MNETTIPDELIMNKILFLRGMMDTPKVVAISGRCKQTTPIH